MNFSVIEPYAPMFWGGLAVTLEVTGAALVLAFALGAVIAVLKVLPCRPLRLLLDFYTSLFRGIPLIVLLFIVYFATPQLTGYKITMFAASVLTLGLNGSATVSETLRGGIEGVDRGQYDASHALGLPYVTMMADVIIPLSRVVPEFLQEDSVFICSGILNTRLAEVLAALEQNGLQIISTEQQEDWCRVTAALPEA